ncbi:MAG: prolipoprotein diacylglyceryl transferase [Clostridia bacterium]|nr:prolipoprotein diacylglyceryl transferase [Clostridia bacterium]
MTNVLFGFLHIYALLIVFAMVLSVVYMSRQEKRLGFQKDTAVDMALYAIPLGIIGARLYDVAFAFERYADNLISILYIHEGGLAIYGGIIGGVLGVWILSRRKRLSFQRLLDMAAPAVIMSQAIGRWGNFFNQEAYGALITDERLQFFPYGVLIGGQWYQATFFYESVWDFLGFLFLHAIRKKTRHDGDVVLLYLCFYGIGRVFIEGLRSDSLYWGSVRVSQALSAVLVLASLALLALRYLRDRRRA